MKRTSPEFATERIAFYVKMDAVRVEHYIRIGEMKKAGQFAGRIRNWLSYLEKVQSESYTYKDVIAAIRTHGSANFIKYHFAS